MGKETQSADKESISLQVMICTYGQEGLKRVATSTHPKVEGVEYLVSCQIEGGVTIPKELYREDFKIITTASKGLSINRNHALTQATAPVLLISDDDTDYSAEGLKNVIEAFRNHPDADIITFRYDSPVSKKFYPDHSVSLNNIPKGYYISSIEIALRRRSIQGKFWFNENFGIGAMFPSGEEDIFVYDCLNAGMKGIFEPITIARHDGPTTSERNLKLPTRSQTKGAVFLRLHPHSWPLRMMAHALREIPLWRNGLKPSPISFCKNWITGVITAKKNKVFQKPNPSIKNYHINE
ncbi:MAG: glycosyltransferase [Muribaculaceae bacterium]|nr:glycosyltransferase [Muribaculaceae bacterium]